MKISIICGYPIPYGMAATSRIFSYAKGLVSLGNDVEVLSWIPTGIGVDGIIANEGVFDGVKFRYTYRRKKTKNKLGRIFEIIVSLVKLVLYLIKSNIAIKYDAVILSSDNILVMSIVRMCNCIANTKLIFIFDEFPIPIRRDLKDKIPEYKIKIYKILLKGFNGYISMTASLLNYYQKIYYHPGIVVSSITDLSRFQDEVTYVKKTTTSEFRIMYMGNMELSKDNVDNILYAISLLKDSYNIHLDLYGTPSQDNKQFLIQLINELDLFRIVHFGCVSYKDVPQKLSEADILVSSQPETIRASGGFPTKLGEYMMAGRPVLCTDVGEISTYFKEEEEIYLAKPNSPEDFARKLRYIFENYSKAVNVAQKARQKIVSKYSHIQAGIIINNFIKQI